MGLGTCHKDRAMQVDVAALKNVSRQLGGQLPTIRECISDEQLRGLKECRRNSTSVYLTS